MSMGKPSTSGQKWRIISYAFILFSLLLLARIGYGQIQMVEAKHAILQGSIHIQPVTPLPNDQTGKIQPGTPIKIVVTVENNSQYPSPAGELFVRYAFAHPLENEARSNIFETEKKPLPSIEPGKQIEIAFDTPHQLPSFLDFVRYDWSMREYQAIAEFNHEENLIGTLALTFSAYYYPGVKKELPNKIPGLSN